MATKGAGRFFGPLTFLALLTGLAGGTLIVAQIEPPDFLSFVAGPLHSLGQGEVVLGLSVAVPLILVIMAYVSSLRLRTPRRPVVGLFLLGFSVLWLVAAYVVTLIGPDEFFTPFALPIAGVALLILANAPRLVEVVIGRICLGFGDAFLRKEKWESASGMLGIARRLLPSSQRVARDQGLALYELGEAEQALDVLALAYEHGDRDPRVVRTLAASIFQLPEELASRVMADALEIDPNNAKIGRKLVDLHLRNKQTAEALPVLEKFYDSDDLEDVCLLGRLNAEQGNVDRALQLARRAMLLEGPPFKRTMADLQVLSMQAPENPAVLLALAELNIETKNRDEAASWYLNLLEVDADNVEARRKLIRIYRELGRLDQTLPHYRQLLRREPESPEMAVEYGQILEDREDFDKGLKVFQDFAARYPDDWRFAYHSAVCLLGLSQLSDAADALERARAIAPADERARIQSLAAKIHSARVDLELGALREQARAQDAPLDLRLSYVERLIAYQQAEEATRELDLLLEQVPARKEQIVRFLEEIVERGEPQFVLLNLLADIHLKDRDFDRCHELHEMMAKQSLHPDEVMADGCRQILRQQPNHLPSLRSHAGLLVKGGHYSDAAAVLGRILELSPPARDALLPMLFEVYYQLGDVDRAVPYGESLLKNDKNNLNLYLRLHELFAKREDYRGAIRILQRALSVAPENRQLKEMLTESKKNLREMRLEELRAQTDQSPDNPVTQHELADLYVEFDRLNDAITAYQRAAQNAEGNFRSLCLVKLSHCLANKQMFDLADETLRELDVDKKDSDHLDDIKHYLYNVGGLFEADEQFGRAHNIYKNLFKIDAGYKDVVDKIELLSRLVR